MQPDVVSRTLRLCWKVIRVSVLTLLAVITVAIAVPVAWNVLAPEGTACDVYRRMIHSMAFPGFIPNDDCPFARVAPIGHFSVRGLNFSIPREFLWLGATDPDGPEDGLYFMFHWPELTPASSYGDQSYHVKATIHECQNISACIELAYERLKRDGNCQPPQSHGDIATRYAIKGMTHVSGPGTDYFFTGYFCNPSEVLECDVDTTAPTNKRCDYRIRLSDQVYLSIGFRKHELIHDFRQMRHRVYEKIRSFNTNAMLPASTERWGEP